IYGRERRLDPNVARLLEFKTGRYAGVISLNTVGSFVPFPPNDPRHETIFNIRGTIIPQMAPLGLGASMGITDLAGIPDMTADGLPELLVGAPFNDTLSDQEDDDPCDTCTFTEMQATPFDCFIPVLPVRTGDNALESEVGGANIPVMAGTWVPFEPADLNVNTPINVDLELTDERIFTMVAFEFLFSGERADASPAPFTVDVLFEDADGPMIRLDVNPGDDPAVDDETAMFTDVNGTLNGTGFILVEGFPVASDEIMSPSVYDGEFHVTLRPSTSVDFDMVQMRVHAFTVTPETHPIRFTYFDGFPDPFSNAGNCAGIDPAPISPLAMEDFKPSCPPLNRTSFPFLTRSLRGVPTYGNRDGHLCGEFQVASALGARNGPTNDNLGELGEPLYQSGHVFVCGSDDLVLPLNTGRDDDNDGVFDDGPFGTWTGLGFRVALMEFFGQPLYISQGGLGMRGGRFRGAWYQPDLIYDPFSLFGYTVDVMPDINAFGTTDTELLISAPGGGTLVVVGPLDMTTDLSGTYTNRGTTSATSVFDTGVQFGNVLNATLFVSGIASDVPVLRVGLDEDGDGKPDELFSRDVLLWNGAGPATAADTPPLLDFDEFFGDTVTILNNVPIPISLPQAALPSLMSGDGTLAIEVLPDCVVTDSQMIIEVAFLVITGLRAEAGYITIIDGDDYTSPLGPPCTAMEGDPETDDQRPMSWPATGCSADPIPQRTYCFHGDVANLSAEDQFNAFGWARHAGDLNLDGVADIACGAPGNDNDPINPDFNCNPEPAPLVNNGKVYLIYGTPTLGSGRPCDLERFEIRGSHNNDQFGRVQGVAGDVDGDTFDDVFFAAEGYDALGSIDDVPNLGADVGFVGVLFGRSFGNAIISIRPEQVGTTSFPGCKFIGGAPGARLGGGTPGNTLTFATEKGQHGVSSAGDFNLDGFQDLLITAPGQEWPGASITFTGPVSEGDWVKINGIAFEFDTDGVVAEGAIPLSISS
ncbi:MAG: integrin alpha, partial [Phycisphaerae bacterium]